MNSLGIGISSANTRNCYRNGTADYQRQLPEDLALKEALRNFILFKARKNFISHVFAVQQNHLALSMFKHTLYETSGLTPTARFPSTVRWERMLRALIRQPEYQRQNGFAQRGRPK